MGILSKRKRRGNVMLPSLRIARDHVQGAREERCLIKKMLQLWPEMHLLRRVKYKLIRAARQVRCVSENCLMPD